MKCPQCGSSKMSRVYGVKEVNKTVERRRECTLCGYRYVTQEVFIGSVIRNKKKLQEENT